MKWKAKSADRAGRRNKNPTVILFAFEKQLSEQQTLRKQAKGEADAMQDEYAS